VLGKHRLDLLPEFVGHAPDGGHGLLWGFALGHLGASFRGWSPTMIPDHDSFEIVSYCPTDLYTLTVLPGDGRSQESQVGPDENEDLRVGESHALSASSATR